MKSISALKPTPQAVMVHIPPQEPLAPLLAVVSESADPYSGRWKKLNAWHGPTPYVQTAYLKRGVARESFQQTFFLICKEPDPADPTGQTLVRVEREETHTVWLSVPELWRGKSKVYSYFGKRYMHMLQRPGCRTRFAFVRQGYSSPGMGWKCLRHGNMLDACPGLYVFLPEKWQRDTKTAANKVFMGSLNT